MAAVTAVQLENKLIRSECVCVDDSTAFGILVTGLALTWYT